MITVSGRSSREGNGNTLQYSCLENPTDRGTWWATAHEVVKRMRHNLETTVTATTIHENGISLHLFDLVTKQQQQM